MESKMAKQLDSKSHTTPWERLAANPGWGVGEIIRTIIYICTIIFKRLYWRYDAAGRTSSNFVKLLLLCVLVQTNK